jgi:predicted nucleic acid-binding protein
MTTNWTLYEALALARHRQPPTAGRLFQIATNIASVVPVDQAVEREALRRFLTWTDKGASVVDHANVLVALQRRCDAILSFDDDFAELVPNTGLQLLR